MTVLLAYASPPEVLIIAVCLLVALLVVVVAFWPELRAEYRISRRPPPRPTRTVSIEITPRFTSPTRSHLRTLGPRPFDWSIDDPNLGTRRLSLEQIAAAYDVPVDLIAPKTHPRGDVWIAPVGTVIDETFPDGPDWTHLGKIADVDPAAFVFVDPR